MFFRKGILKICSKFTGEHPYESVISPVNLLYIFRTPFLKNATGWWLLKEAIFLVRWSFTKNKFFLYVFQRLRLQVKQLYCIIVFTRTTSVYSDFVHVPSGSF